MIIIFTPREAEEVGSQTVAEVSHSHLKCPTPDLFKKEWTDAENHISDTLDEWQFTDIVKEMKKRGWTFFFHDVTDVEY